MEADQPGTGAARRRTAGVDRRLLRARDDRLTGEYLAGALLGMLFSALAGTPVGVAVCAAAVLMLAVVRRDTLHEVRFTALSVCAAPIAVGAMTGSVVLLGVGAGSFVLALALSLRRPDRNDHDG